MPKLSLPRPPAGAVVVALAATGLAFSAGVAVAGPAKTPAELAVHGGATRLHGDQTTKIRKAVEGGRARNVILLIGDGMGDSEITVARNYQSAPPAASGHRRPAADRRSTRRTRCTRTTGKPDYVPDSAATGTGWATGIKTYNSAISVDVDGKAVPDPARAGQAAPASRPATSPPPRSRTRPRPSQVSHVSSRGPATARSPRARPAPTDALENGGARLDHRAAARHPARRHAGRRGDARSPRRPRPARGRARPLPEQAQVRGYQVVTDSRRASPR